VFSSHPNMPFPHKLHKSVRSIQWLPCHNHSLGDSGLNVDLPSQDYGLGCSHIAGTDLDNSQLPAQPHSAGCRWSQNKWHQQWDQVTYWGAAWGSVSTMAISDSYSSLLLQLQSLVTLSPFPDADVVSCPRWFCSPWKSLSCQSWDASEDTHQWTLDSMADGLMPH
jgi:hypothetical protein